MGSRRWRVLPHAVATLLRTAGRIFPSARAASARCVCARRRRGVRPDLGEPPATSVRGDSLCLADRADRDRHDRRRVRALPARAGRQAGSARRACRSYVRRLVFHARRVRSRPDRLCVGGVAIVLAGAGADSDDHHAGGVLLLQDAIWPEQFWLARRFLTEILPGALIFVSAAIFAPVWMARRGSHHVEVVADPVHGDRNRRRRSCWATDTCLRRCRFEDTSNTRT